MKTWKLFLTCLLVAFFNYVEVVAQPLSGTYTIGGAGSAFATVSAAASALNNNGVSGPVVFNISPGVYNGNIVIGPIQGASVTNQITFQSSIADSTSVIISHPSGTSTLDNFALRLNGAAYVTFKYMTFQRSGSNIYTQVIDIINASQHINFYHNRISGVPASSAATYQSLVYGANNSSVSNIVFDGNRFENGSYGMWLLGISQLPCCVDVGNKVLNNHFTGQYHCAVMLSYQGGPKIIGNTIESVSTTNGYGIYTFFCDNDLQIQRNKISIINGRGIYVHNASITGYPENLIANNFVSVGGTLASSGINLENSRSCNLYYNSILIYNANQTSSAFRIDGIGSGFNNLKNNILMNSGGGYASYISTSTSSPILASDFNNLYTSDTLIGFWQSAGSQPTLAAYKTVSGLEQNSVSLDPGFISLTDLHATSILMNNLGSPVATTATPVTNDIDQQLRHPLTPDIGADEYSLVSLALIAVDSIASFCEGSIPGIRVQVKNLSVHQFSDSLQIAYRLNIGSWQYGKYMLTIPPTDTVTVVLTGQNLIPATGAYNLTCAISHPEDLEPVNDSLIKGVFIQPSVGLNLGNDFNLCLNQNDTILTGLAANLDYLWHDNTQSPFWIAEGAKMGVGTHQVWVKVSSTNHCVWRDTVIIQVVGIPVPAITAHPSFKTLMGGDSVTVICQKFTNLFSCGSFAGYLWNNAITDPVVTILPNSLPLGFMDVNVVVIDQKGCSGYDTLRVYVDDCQGIEDADPTEAIRISPNPSSSGIFYVDISSPAQLRIFNISGQEIEYQFYNTDFENRIVVDLSHCKHGLYLMKVNNDNGYSVIKLVKN